MADDLVERLARALAACGIPYMVIGGQAVLLYGSPRLTGDVDITVGLEPGRVADVLDVVRETGITPLVDPQTFPQETFVLPCEDPATGLRVDFIFSVTPYERAAIERARHVLVGETSVSYASPEDVIIHKIFAGRPRDLEDVRGILAKRAGLDYSYIRLHLLEFEATTNEPYARRFEDLLKSVS